jgi:hypothetical protein
MAYEKLKEATLVIVHAVLKRTTTEVVFVLTPVQYAHYQYLRGEQVCESMPMDQEVVGEMAALLEHLDK